MSDAAKTPVKKAAKAKKPAKATEHPTTAVMVKAAITALKEKKGSSLAAIKKYIQANYKGIDMVRTGPFIRRYLKKAVADKALEQVKGSYRLAKKAEKPKVKKATKAKKAKSPKKAKKPKTPKKKAPKKASTKKSPKKAAKKPAAKKPAAKKAAKPKAAKKPAAKKATKAKKPAKK